MGRGRPSRYAPELAETICARLAAGEPLKGICRDDGMPHESTVRGWARDDIEGFATPYARAREIGCHALADELLSIADDGSNDWMATNDPDNPGYRLNGEHSQRSRLRVDTRKWLLAKMLPAVYGDKVQHTGADGAGPVGFVLCGQPEAKDADEWASKHAPQTDE